tara:strand:+ start:847 stop:1092 length:246 start_codon:yes stop_codon:yes gene_type:complete
MKYPLSANQLVNLNNKPTPNTKGELMSKTYNEEELKNIDASLPIDISKKLRESKEDTFFYIMNYNKNILGELEDMRKKISI